MKPATVSIVIPVFNRAHLVCRAIDSAIEQTVPCQIVIVDHGSTDDIASIVARYGGKVLYIRRDVDLGPIECWRDGVRHSTGEFLHFTYDDDWIQPTFVEECLARLRDGVAFVYTRATVHDPRLNPLQVILRHPPGINPVRDIVHYLLSAPLTISPGCAMFRRSDVEKNLLMEIPGAGGDYGKRSGVGEDLLLFLLTSLDYDMYCHIPEPLADFLAHPGSITANAQETGRQQALAEAYSVAKNFYSSQPRALRPFTGMRKMAFASSWALRSLLSPSLAKSRGLHAS